MSISHRFPLSTLRGARLAAVLLTLAGLGNLVPGAVAQELSVRSGLVLWLKADADVVADVDGSVSNWSDQSGNGNDAWPLGDNYGPTGTEYPVLVRDVVNSRPAIRFDGVDDVLEIANAPSLQPAEGGWTVFFVARRLSESQGDFPQVIGSRPWLAGLDAGWSVAFDNTGRVASHFADGTVGHDVPATRAASALSMENFEMWQVEEDPDAGTTAFYRQGDLETLISSVMPAASVLQDNAVHIGREMGGANNRRAHMEIAEILIYNRALPAADRIAVTTYLSGRYGFGFVPNQAPTVALTQPTEGTSLTAPAELDVVATASDPDGSIERVEFYEGSRLIGTAFAPPYRLPLRILTPATFSFTAVAVDDRGERTVSQAVTVAVAGEVPSTLTVENGLQLWLRADAGITADAGGLVSRWEDQSPLGNDAGPLSDAYGPLGTELPLRRDNAVAGKPVVRFDGEDDVLEIANSPSLQPGSGDWTVFFVAQRLSDSVGDFPQVIGSRPWVTGLDKGWAVSISSSGLVTSHYADGSAGHDVPQTVSDSPLSNSGFQVWQVEEDRAGEMTRFHVGGQINGARATRMPVAPIDQTEPVHLGREMGGANNRRANLDLAEVLVFNRILDATEGQAVNSYLSGRYGLAMLIGINEPPTVTLTAPVAGAEIDASVPVTLTANAADADGGIVQVEFIAGSRSLGIATNAPFTVTSTNLPLGDLQLQARATDNLGAVTTSAAVAVRTSIPNAPKPTTVVGILDYSDTFTVGAAGEPTEENPRPNGMYNKDDFGGYDVENTHGNPAAKWTPTANFSFNTPGNSTGPGITTVALGNAGAATGFAQSGGGDFNFTYGLRESYVVQVDAILPLDRLDVGSYTAAGDAISATGSLTVFFRRDTATGPGIGLYNGTVETPVTDTAGQPVRTGITDNDWHTFAVHFDRPAGTLGIYVDGFPKASVNLAQFAGGTYATFSNGAVGVGGAGFDGTQAQWMDNFMVGAPAIVGIADYSDTFTVTTPPRRDGLYNDNSGGAYSVEDTHGNPAATWTPIANFSFNTPGSSTGPAILEAATGNPGAATGLAQSGGGDFSIGYGVRSDYVIEVDAVLPLDRLDISTWTEVGAQLASEGGLSVFLRKDSSTNPGIGLYDGEVETAVTDSAGSAIRLGIDDANWHRFAVRFDRPNNRVSVFADGNLKAIVDLAQFAGGRYAGFANTAVGIGGAGYDGTQAQWFDNFTVGGPGPGAGAAPAVEDRPTLGVRREAQEIVLEWTGTATLEQTPALGGTAWQAVAGATSPHRVSTAGNQGFYRLRR